MVWIAYQKIIVSRLLDTRGINKPCGGRVFSFEGIYSPSFSPSWFNTHRLIAQNPRSPPDCSVALYLRKAVANEDACCDSTTIQRRIFKCQTRKKSPLSSPRSSASRLRLQPAKTSRS